MITILRPLYDITIVVSKLRLNQAGAAYSLQTRLFRTLLRGRRRRWPVRAAIAAVAPLAYTAHITLQYSGPPALVIAHSGS